MTLKPSLVKLFRSSSIGTRWPGVIPFEKAVPGITRFGAASFHFCTLLGSPNTTAVTLRRSISASTSFMYSPDFDGYSAGVQGSFTHPNCSSLVLGSDAVNFEVFGHIG